MFYRYEIDCIDRDLLWYIDRCNLESMKIPYSWEIDMLPNTLCYQDKR